MSFKLIAAWATCALAAWAQLELASQVQPVYPPEAKQAGIAGRVKLEVQVSPQGKVAGVHALSGHPLLVAAAEEAVRQWEYKPPAGPVTVDVTLNFELPDGGAAALEVSGSRQQMRLSRMVKPVYPVELKARGIAGRVELEARIDKEGNVTHVRVLEGDPGLVEAAVDAVRQWQYEPMAVNGDPVDVVTRIDVNFALSQ